MVDTVSKDYQIILMGSSNKADKFSNREAFTPMVSMVTSPNKIQSRDFPTGPIVGHAGMMLRIGIPDSLVPTRPGGTSQRQLVKTLCKDASVESTKYNCQRHACDREGWRI